MAAKENTIGWLSRQTNTKVQTIRYYEQIDLMPEVPRSEGNRRLYTDGHVGRLAFIRHSRQLGFSLDQIRELLNLSDDPGRPCHEVDAIAQMHLEDVQNKIVRLKGYEKELKRMVCECAGGHVSGCRIIEVLSDHSLCLEPGH